MVWAEESVSIAASCDAVSAVLGEDGAGSRVVMRGGGEVPGGRIGAVAAPLYVKALERENRVSLRKLKRLVEGAAG